MYWYRRDPNAALVGMKKLTLEQRGLFNSILDLIYAQDGAVPDNDLAVCRTLGVQHHCYRRIKAELMAAGKLWITAGYLDCPRVELTLKAANRLAQQQARVARDREAWHEKVRHNSAIVTGGVTRGVNSTLPGRYRETFPNDLNMPRVPTDQDQYRKKEAVPKTNAQPDAAVVARNGSSGGSPQAFPVTASLEASLRKKGWI